MNLVECRICFVDSDLISLFNTIDGTRISKQVEMIGEVTISENDYLPKYICTSCISKVRAYIQFQRQIEHSHRHFYVAPETIVEVETTEIINQNDRRKYR